MKTFDNFIILLKTVGTDETVPTTTHNLFWSKNLKYCRIPCIPHLKMRFNGYLFRDFFNAIYERMMRFSS